MNKEVKNIINLILAAIGLAMGVAVVILSIIETDTAQKDLIMMLGIAVFSLGLFAINNMPKAK